MVCNHKLLSPLISHSQLSFLIKPEKSFVFIHNVFHLMYIDQFFLIHNVFLSWLNVLCMLWECLKNWLVILRAALLCPTLCLFFLLLGKNFTDEGKFSTVMPNALKHNNEQQKQRLCFNIKIRVFLAENST